MTSGVANVSEVQTFADCLTTETPCLVCVTTLPLDDEQPKLGMVSWKILPGVRLKMGIAVGFVCPNGHSSDDDPELLKAFPTRRFW